MPRTAGSAMDYSPIASTSKSSGQPPTSPTSIASSNYGPKSKSVGGSDVDDWNMDYSIGSPLTYFVHNLTPQVPLPRSKGHPWRQARTLRAEELRPAGRRRARKDDETTDSESHDEFGSTESEETETDSPESTGGSDTSDEEDGDEERKRHRGRRRRHHESHKDDKPNYLLYGLGILIFLLSCGGAYYFFVVDGGSLSGQSTPTSSSTSISSSIESATTSSVSTGLQSPAPTSGTSTPNNDSTSTTSASAPGSTSTTNSSLPSPLFVIYSDQVDTIPEPSDLQGFNVFILAFWTIKYGIADVASDFVAMDNSSRAALKAKYVAAGVKLMVSVFGSEDTPTTSGASATDIADQVAAFVIEYDLDGADVDYEDFDAMDAGTGEQWVINLTKELRAKLPSPYIISHAPIAPWFAASGTPGGAYATIHQSVGSLIDFYNIQFYNQDDYNDCTSLVTTSVQQTGTALLQIVASGVEQQKVVLGKPAGPTDAETQDYMTAEALATCVAQAKAQGWSAGLMLWEWGDQQSGFVTTAWGT